ncbi:hypothetical protein [Paremcibacter congregatus]|uniref:Uncharacterized protein n=1 Tax=Paremcibacter congregatus TaxID=2043170 RepID=A0A2G4YSW8_9PROT|nr:hypothetical protein [Paremcibacter congregatus]PHZ85393.1 hypothetical protein CRD36_08350 [Paremcibacter congregatus]QDE27674.1 hypothetical protein FIV45_10485 [Paremcibacter congregatus]
MMKRLLLICLFSFQTHTVMAEDVCEIIYSPIPHINAAVATGEDRLEGVFKLNTRQQEDLFKSLVTVTDSFFSSSPYVENIISEVKSHKLVSGGYEGITTPSISMTVALDDRVTDKMQAMQKIAAAMAFFFIQDSVLVICPDDGKITETDSYSFDLHDQGGKQFLSAENAQLFFGMMIGMFNGPQDLGYTYYASRGVFSTLVPLSSVDHDRRVLEKLSATLKDLTQGQVDLAITPHRVDIAFPHNDWASDPQGGHLKDIMGNSFSLENLLSHRQKFLQHLDQHISRMAAHKP